MYQNHTVGVVIPCHNEQLLITRVIDTMPDYVDRIYVVDDHSSDNTVQVVKEYITRTGSERVELIEHTINQGPGGGVISGYRAAIADQMAVIVVVDGDAQMDPADLPAILQPIIDGRADFSKGNRLASGEAWTIIPRARYIGNVALSLMTKVASGYWHVFDSQTAYTAISLKAAKTLDLDRLWRRYGYPNHILILLNIHNFRVANVPVRPIYGIGERSGLKIWRVIFTISWLLMRGFIWRLFHKYVVRDAHPLVLFYFFGVLTFIPGFIFGTYLVIFRLTVGRVAPTSALFAMFLTMFGLNFLMFALWFDMDSNRDLKA
ncbi:MAG TPA: glycosyltransferase family 2 protein [Aggregatilineales bacterium]|nr:glycosyltransferase family 2 protein [Aggregatilineales bacterium]